MKKRIKTNGIIITFAALLVLSFSDIFLRPMRPEFGDEFLRIAGFGCILLGQLFRVSARGYKAEQSQNSHTLVCAGPYMAVRNPMYLGILLIGLGIVLVLFRWWVGLIFLSVFMARYLSLVSQEERKLMAAFPGQYKDYMLKVPRIFPAFGMMHREVSAYLPFKFSWLRKEVSSILAVILVTLCIEFRQRAKGGRLGVYLEESAGVITVFILFICLAIYLNGKQPHGHARGSYIDPGSYGLKQ